MLCSYGCGREAKYTFKNKKNCCSKITAHCPAVKKKNSHSLKRAYKNGNKKVVILPKRKCKFCSSMITTNNFVRHEQACKLNPEIKKILCPICGNPTNPGCTTCSRECRLEFFGPPNIWDDSQLTYYRTICFRHHEKKCIICDEENFLDAHHHDKNIENNHPINLVPLCILHHKYIHHPKLKYIVKECIEDYIDKFTKNWNSS